MRSKISKEKLSERPPKSGYGIIPRGTAKYMSGTEFKVYCELVGYADNKGKCFPSVTSISEGVGMTYRNTQKAIKSLEEANWLKRNLRSNHTTIYQMYYLKSSTKNDNIINLKKDEKSTTSILDTSSRSIIDVTRTSLKDVRTDHIKRPIKETILLTKSDDFQNDTSEIFDENIINELIQNENSKNTFNYIKNVILNFTKDNSIERWSMSDQDENLIKTLEEVMPHLLTKKLDYGLYKAVEKEDLRLGNILHQAIATIKN